jgi:hypothetical protein
MDDKELAKLGKKLQEYCDKYFIPQEHLFEILNDQKVTPMIRGKATEFNAYELLRSLLNENEWSVQKLNLSAQPGSPDQDISITHKPDRNHFKSRIKKRRERFDDLWRSLPDHQKAALQS